MASSKIKGINIKIGADTTGLDKALGGIESSSRKTKSELSEVNRALKNSADSAVLWKQKQDLLTEALEDSQKKVKLLEDAQEQVKKQFEKGEIDDGQYRAFERELENARSASKNLEEQLGDTEAKVKELGDKADSTGDDVKDLGDEAKTAGDKAEKSGEGGFTVLKGALADLVADGIKAAKDGLVELSQQAMDFEDSMAKVSTIADASVPIEELEDSIIELSNKSGIESKVIAENVYNAISAGQKTADAVNFVDKATTLAKAGFADTGDALDILTTIMNAYGLEANEVTKVSDVLIQTQNLGKTTVAELSSAMGKVIPTANAYNVSLEQLAAGYAITTANGVATAESTTYINAMLNELGKSGTKVSDTLKEKTGKSFAELMESGASLADVLQIIKDASGESAVDEKKLADAQDGVKKASNNVENAQLRRDTRVQFAVFLQFKHQRPAHGVLSEQVGSSGTARCG